jgi:hypothetical protein
MARSFLNAQTQLRWASIAVLVTAVLSAGVGCELIAGTRSRSAVVSGSSSGGGGESSGESAKGSSESATGSAGSGSAGGGGATVNLWPDSATTLCSKNGESVVCSMTEATAFDGQDGNHQGHIPQYKENDGGTGRTFTDSVTGLVWQGNLATVQSQEVNWNTALIRCRTLNFADKDDWRLPSRRELASLLDAGHLPDPTLPASVAPIFPREFDELLEGASKPPDRFYWTDARAKDDSTKAWAFVLLSHPFMVSEFNQDTSPGAHALCVRGTTVYRRPQLIIEGAVVRDESTGLTWQRSVSSPPLSWTEALAACNTLELDAMNGFRLPSVKELLSLVDDTKVSPAIDLTAFPETPTAQFWTSTPYAAVLKQALIINFARGDVTPAEQSSPNQLRCVR